MKENNIILIGMPGCGKSTVGVVLAKMLGCGFVDCDLVIQNKYGKLLWQLIDEVGCEGFISLENETLASLNVNSHVIATGGSAIYGDDAMAHLSEIGTVVYLSLPLESVCEHIGDTGTSRGVVYREARDLEGLYRERVPLYEKYAHVIVDCTSLSITEAARAIVRAVEERKIEAKY